MRELGLTLAVGLCIGMELACTDLDSTASPDEILQLTASPRAVPADGFSTVTLVAEMSPQADENLRDVIFTTTLGSFPSGSTTSARTLVVAADEEGRAAATLRTGTQTGRAVVTAEIRDGDKVKVSRSTEVSFDPVPASDVITLELGAVEAPADGATVTRVLARIAAEVPNEQRTLTFTTTAGSLGSLGSSSAQARAGTDNVAAIDLISPRLPASAVVTATVNSLVARGTVQFVHAYPETAALTLSGSLRMPATFSTRVSLRMELFRSVGTVTRGTEVRFHATDETTENVFGFFSGVTPSDANGVVTAEFTPGNTRERGEATIRGNVVGTDVFARIRIEIVSPPP